MLPHSSESSCIINYGLLSGHAPAGVRSVVREGGILLPRPCPGWWTPHPDLPHRGKNQRPRAWQRIHLPGSCLEPVWVVALVSAVGGRLHCRHHGSAEQWNHVGCVPTFWWCWSCLSCIWSRSRWICQQKRIHVGLVQISQLNGAACTTLRYGQSWRRPSWSELWGFCQPFLPADAHQHQAITSWSKPLRPGPGRGEKALEGKTPQKNESTNVMPQGKGFATEFRDIGPIGVWEQIRILRFFAGQQPCKWVQAGFSISIRYGDWIERRQLWLCPSTCRLPAHHIREAVSSPHLVIIVELLSYFVSEPSDVLHCCESMFIGRQDFVKESWCESRPIADRRVRALSLYWHGAAIFRRPKVPVFMDF